jgi:hypothetical protein
MSDECKVMSDVRLNCVQCMMCLLVWTVLALCSSTASAQSEDADSDNQPPVTSATESESKPADAEEAKSPSKTVPEKKSSLDEQLLERLEGKGTKSESKPQQADAPENARETSPAPSRAADDDGSPADDDAPLLRAIRRMRSAQERIARGDTGEATQDVQIQIVKDIQELIDLAKRRPPSPPSPPQQPEADDKPMQQDGENADGSEDQVAGASGEGARKQDDGADETTEQTGKPNQAEVELARRQQLINEVWGHLPPALRRELLNINSERYLPKYDEWVRRYYESLAEPSGKP